VGAPEGELFGKIIATWRSLARAQFGLPDKPIIIVGHQPEFFHPGVLSKFIAGSSLASEVDGVLLHLVVDHHIGNSGVIEVPDETGEYLATSTVHVASVDTKISMKDQQRTNTQDNSAFGLALQNAKGENLAMQFANATNALMAPYANIDYCIAGTSLLQTDFGKALLCEMQQRPDACIAAYNNAVDAFPDCGVACLGTNELPLWHGKHNVKVSGDFSDLRPRALLLTLLARVVLGDLIVHGTGGFGYDRIMETWVSDWLGISPCAMVMQTATLHLALHAETIDDARHAYFAPPKQMIEAIQNAPYRSPERTSRFLAMHTWLEQQGAKPDIGLLQRAKQIAARRNWAFPLYPSAQLSQLTKSITSCAGPKFS
jgi:hypothetical protein